MDVLGDLDRTRDFRLLQQRALPARHRPRHVRARGVRRATAGTTCRSPRRSRRPPRCRWSTSRWRSRAGISWTAACSPPPTSTSPWSTGAKFVIVINPLVPVRQRLPEDDPDDARQPGAPGQRHGLPADRLPGVQAARAPAAARVRPPVVGEVPGRGHHPDRARAQRRADVRDEHHELHRSASTSPATASSRSRSSWPRTTSASPRSAPSTASRSRPRVCAR